MNFVTGDEEFNPTLLEAAKSSLIFELIDKVLNPRLLFITLKLTRFST